MKEMHYLKQELYDRVKTDTDIFDFLQNGSLDGLWYWDLEHPNHEWMSERFWEMFGIDPSTKTHLSSEWQKIIFEDDLKSSIEHLNKHLEDPSYPYDQIVRYRHQDGSTVWIRCRGMAIRDANGKPIRMLGAHINVSSIYQTFEDLVRSKEREFETLFDRAQVGLMYITGDRKLIRANPRFAEMLGYGSPEEMVGLSMRALHLSEENFIAFGTLYFDALIQGAKLNIEYTIRKKDGTPLWVSISGKALSDDIPADLSKGVLWSIEDISQRKRFETELKRSNERWKAALSANEDGVWEWDLEHDALYTSERWNALHDYTQEHTITTQTWTGSIHPDDLQEIEQRVNDVLTNPNTANFVSEYRFRSSKGTYKWILDRGIVLERSKEGRALHIIGTHHDISERKRFEEALITERDRSQHYLDIVGEMIIALDTTGTIILINEKGRTILEADGSEIIGKNWFSEFLIPDELERVQGYFQELMAGSIENLRYVENHIRTLKGAKRLIAWHNTLTYDETHTINGLISSGRDITDQRIVENELKAERARFKLAIEGTKDGLWDWNILTHEAYVSERYETMLGYELGELPHSPDAWSDLLHPEDKAAAFAAVQSYLDSRGKHNYDSTFRMRCKDGSWRWIRGRGKALFDTDGRPLRLVGFNTDVTEERELHNRLSYSEKRFHTIFDSAPVGIFYFDREKIIRESNAAFAKILGTTPKQLNDFNMQERLNDTTMLKAIDQCLSEGAARFKGYYTSVTSAKKKYGEVIYQAIYDDENQIIGGIGIADDQTVQKSLEEEIALKETLHKQLFTDNKVPTLFIDPANHGAIVDANIAAAKYYGYSLDELTGMSIMQLNTMTPDEINTEMHHALHHHRDHFLFQHRLKSGEIRDVEVYSGPITYAQKQILYSIIHDVTEKNRLAREVSQQHDHLQNVINGMSEAMTVIDQNYNVLLMNNTAKEMAVAHFIADPQHPKCHEISHHSPLPCALDNHPCPLKQAIESGTTQKALHRHLNAQDEERLVEVTLTPLKNSEGEIYAFVESGHDVTDLLEIKEELNRQINFDALTGLPSKILFMDRLKEFIAHAQRTQAKAAVILINIDNFKIINESFGHQAGDLVIKMFAEWIKSVIRAEDTLARLSGDSYAILLENIDEDLVAVRILENLKALVETSHVDILGQEVYFTYSAGIAIYPQDGNSAESIFKNADAAIYEAKEGGRNTYRYYTDELTQKAFHRVVMDASLRDAIRNDEFVLYYQPQYNGQSGTLIGMEALIRWNHHSMGLVPPGKFIPILESSHLIIPVGQWILETAFKQALLWHEAGLEPGVISVNLSMVQLATGEELIKQIRSLLESTGCKPEWIGLEMTESLMMHNPDETIALLRTLRDLGFLIAMDDFGTGYSSLAYLKKMPISKLKIDKSFIDGLPHDEDDIAMARSIIALAKNMNLEVIAEGVEREEQKAFLLTNGCFEIQGYLYGRPMPSKEIEKLLGHPCES
ncbi:MAG: PAS domain S-box protein [Campylobacterales bacterium]|nr:PAS domain S-box protein [Campylobacterales bacterium]